MIIKIVEYEIKEGKLQVVKAAIEKFTKTIQSHEPQTFYEAYQREDSLEFVHIMKFPDAAAEEAHKGAEYTQDFVKILYPRCEIKPQFTNLTTIGFE